MFILMKYANTNSSHSRVCSHRVGVFRTRKGANRVMARLAQVEKRKPMPASFKVEREYYYSTWAFCDAIVRAYWNWQDRRYAKLMNKFTRLQRKLDAMRRDRG